VIAARVAFLSAVLGCLLIMLQIGYHLAQLTGFRASFDAKFYFLVFGELLVGAVVVALPALSIFYFRAFRIWFAVTTPLYPVFLAAGFWIANSFGDGLAYGIWFLYILMPISAVYTLILSIDGWTLKAQTAQS
jgi:hypothetical protein